MPVQTFDDGSTIQTFDDGSTLATGTDGSLSSSPSITDSGPASALSGIADTVTGALGAVGSFLFGASAPKLPQPNPLFDYASYNYILGIAVLTDDQLNSPDTTYMRGMKLPLICKSASADPSNRVKTAFGSQEFYIDNLEINSTIGLEKGSNTNVLNMTFDIIEPYSMGMFFMALQQAAWSSKHDNWTDAPFLLTIEFKGNKETGSMVSIPNTKRYIPFKFLETEMKVTEKGSIYSFKAYPTNGPALDNANKQLKTDTSVAGKTVQEILQTGEKSLQAVINNRLQDLKNNGTVAEPDQIVILFPKDLSSAGSGASGGTSNAAGAASTTTATAPTVDPASTTSGQGATAIQKQLGVTVSKINSTLVQDKTAVNELGQASLGFGTTRKGDAPLGKERELYDPETKRILKGSNFIDPKTGEFRFSQNTDILNAINQVMLFSDFAEKTLAPDAISKEGYRKWWRIDTQVYTVSSNANLKTTGIKPRIIVYRVVTYNTHASRLMPPNTKAPGFANLAKQAVKKYDYIYTGKNVDIMSFDIKFNVAFAKPAMAAPPKDTGDNKLAPKDSGSADPKKANIAQTKEGNEPEKKLGVNTTRVNPAATITKTANKGGGGLESEAMQAARMFHDVTTSQSEMLELNLRILGDPYYIAQSGQGNYTSKPASQNLNKDGTVNYQNGEVDIIVNFRTPVDINQTTGLYDFGKSSKSGPVLMWSGLYMLLNVVSRFNSGQFTQELKGSRRDMQEGSKEGKPLDNATPQKTKTADPADTGDVVPLPGQNAKDANGNPVGNNGWGEG